LVRIGLVVVMVGANKRLDYFLFWRTIRTIMENLLLIIKKVPLVTWKAFLVLWALFLGFVGLMIKFGGPVVVAMAREAGTEGYKRSSDDGFSEKESDWRYDYPTKRDNYKPYQ